jgi:hypothetical protein
MELIDEWIDHERVSPVSATSAPPASARDFHDALQGFEPPPLSMHCYGDVAYPWIQIVFQHLITPDVALRLGQALAAVPSAGPVYFNSLRPRVVYFLVGPAVESPADLPALRYGVTVAELESCWA